MNDNRDSIGAAPQSTPRCRVLLIEAVAETAAVMCRLLGDSGMDTRWARSGTQAVDLTRAFGPHVVLVDLELPDTNGVELIRWLSRVGNCGIVVVTGFVPYASNILCLEVGADDFIAKPASPRELVARIRAVHRRSAPRQWEPAPVGSAVDIGPVKVDFQQRRVTDAKGRRVEVTGAEFAVLQTLVEAHGKAVSRDRLSETALRRPWRAEDRSIDQLIFGLRRKISSDNENHQIIQTVRGAGYLIPIA